MISRELFHPCALLKAHPREALLPVQARPLEGQNESQWGQHNLRSNLSLAMYLFVHSLIQWLSDVFIHFHVSMHPSKH